MRVGGLARIEETWMPENSFLQEFLAYAQDWRYTLLSPPFIFLAARLTPSSDDPLDYDRL